MKVILGLLALVMLFVPSQAQDRSPSRQVTVNNKASLRQQLLDMYSSVVGYVTKYSGEKPGAKLSRDQLSLGLFGWLYENNYSRTMKDIPIEGRDNIPVVGYDEVKRAHDRFGDMVGIHASHPYVNQYGNSMAVHYWGLPVPNKDADYVIVADYPAGPERPIWCSLRTYTGMIAENADPDDTGTDAEKFVAYFTP